MSWDTILLLLLWGTVAGVDLVSLPQGLLGRPIVAGTVAGLLLGDLDAGLRMGVVFELFALDVLPVGAARYPDFGPATVATVVWATGLDWRVGLGPAALLGLALAWVGGRSMEGLRRANGRRLRLLEPLVDGGDHRALVRLQWMGLAGDAARAALLTAAGIGAALLGRVALTIPAPAGRSLGLVIIAGGLVAALGGAVRRTPSGSARIWLGLGLAAGLVTVWLA